MPGPDQTSQTPDFVTLRDAYPFGERAYWPYKAWLKQVKAWKAAHARGAKAPSATPQPHRAITDPTQESLL